MPRHALRFYKTLESTPRKRYYKIAESSKKLESKTDLDFRFRSSEFKAIIESTISQNLIKALPRLVWIA
ncbi:hypothetical protein [uncultured Helicobacter sp.]|uniref:hypothetical protein n=1 Tax=uncultured Helicobacter sp. TaxID=175537 RepID=UPI003751B5EB